ncbi:MAG: transcriptional regulator of arginine metabolism [Desulforhopalus sp.]|jgi:transcriptional regulator of arginine metabolism
MKIADQLQLMLSRGIAGNQKELVKAFADIGVITTQSAISRALKKINAIKSVDDNGNSIYTLLTAAPAQKVVSPTSDFFESLIHNIEHNGHLIVVHTKPGTAMTVAKFIDEKKLDQIMGTVAGDDTIIIIPTNVSRTPQVADHVKVYLSSLGIME